MTLRMLAADFVTVSSKRLFAAGVAALMSEGEGECKCETAAGQFSIFGAIEENGGRGFMRIFSDEEFGSRAVRMALS